MLSGSMVAVVTPMDADGSIDYRDFARVIDFHVREGTQYLVVAGTTGESATLTHGEHVELIERACELAAGRVPIIAGTGSNSTAQTIQLSLDVAGSGIDAYLLVVPYYNKPMQEGMVRHFSAIADAVEKPVMLYNVPGRTVADMLPATVARLAEHENIFGIKEATGNIERLKEIRALVDPSFRLYSGDDFTVLDFLREGGHGVVTVSGNVVPKAMAQLCRLAREERFDEAEALDATLQPLNKALFAESNPIPVKWALAQMGLMDGYLRLPLTEYDTTHHESMRAALRAAGVATKG